MKIFTTLFITFSTIFLTHPCITAQNKTFNKKNLTEHKSIKDSRFFLLNGFEFKQNKKHERNTESFVLSDYDNDGKKDLLTVTSAEKGGYLTFNRAKKTYPSVSLDNFPEKIYNPNSQNLFSNKSKTTALKFKPKYLVSGDFNNDGKMDAVVTAKGKKGFSIYYGDGTGKFKISRTYDKNSYIKKIFSQDVFRGDGLIDLITLNQNEDGDELVIHRRDYSGNHFFEQRIPFDKKITDIKAFHFRNDDSQNILVSAEKTVYIFSADHVNNLADYSRKYSVEKRTFNKRVNGISIGRFSEITHQQLAVLFNDAAISLFDINPDKKINSWKFSNSVMLECAAKNYANLELKKANLSPYINSDLTVIDKENGIIYLIDKNFFKKEKIIFAASKPKRKKTDLIIAKKKINEVVYQRTSLDALDDIILLGEYSEGPNFIPTATEQVLTVNLIGDQMDGDPDDGVCDIGNAQTGYTGKITLHAALMHLLAEQSTGTINFSVSGKILINSDMPYPSPTGYYITEGIVIDGTTAPDYKGSPVVELSGETIMKMAGGDGANLTLMNDDVIKGLDITNGEYGIIDNAPYDNCVIEGNYIGVDQSGSNAKPNIIGIGAYAYNAKIGGTEKSQRNIISGNTNAGIKCASGNYMAPGSRNIIKGNYIGTDTSGLKAIGNKRGIHLVNGPAAHDVLIGGFNANEGNLISGDSIGIEIAGLNFLDDPPSAEIYSNKIGTNATATDSLPNQLWNLSLHRNKCYYRRPI